MLNKLRNKRGAAVGFMLAFAATAFTAALVNLSLPQIKDPFRARKAIEYCVQDGGTQEYCETMVGQLSKAEILDSIRDTAVSPKYDNHGNF